MTPTLPLSRTLLCLSCEALYPTTLRACPVCASGEGWPVARWLERKEKERG